MANNKIRVAITQGDTNGIGYELILKTFAEPEILELCTPIIYGSPKIANYHKDALQLQCQFSIVKDAREARDGRVNLLPCCDEVKVELGKSTIEASTAAVQALEKALADSHEGLFDVLVCGPMNKGGLQMNEAKFPGIVKYVENSIGEGKKALAVYLYEIARVALVCNGGAKDAASSLSQEDIVDKAKTLHATLKRDFRLSNPRIAILAINSAEGNEEKDIIVPAVNTLSESGVQAFGPYLAEDFFESRKYEAFDAVLAMYSGQVEQLIQKQCDEKGVVALTNLPLVCTMPKIDTQYDIAGKNMGDEATLRQALYTAIDIFRYEKEYDEPMANPLPKLYHERPDNGEKLRFSIPKKKEE